MSNPSIPAAPIPEMAGAISSEGSRASGGIHTDATVQHPNVADLLRQLANAEAEAKRAKENEEKAVAESKRAKENEEKAVAEAKQAKENEEKAEAEAKQAKENEERAEEKAKRAHAKFLASEEVSEHNQKRLRGLIWLNIFSFALSSNKMGSKNEYENFIVDGRQSPSIWEKMMPPLPWLKSCKVYGPVKEESIRRSAPEFEHGPWGEEISAGGAQRAHLVPFSYRCCFEWLCLFLPFVFWATSESEDRELLNCCMVLGLYHMSQNRRLPFTCILHSSMNFFPLRC